MSGDTNRLAVFRQMREAIRGSENYLVIGIDVAKDNHHAFFGTPRGRTLRKELVFNNDSAGFHKLIASAEEMQSRHSLPGSVFGIEPTGNYHKPLADYLIKRDKTIVYVSSVAVKKNRSLMDGRWDKNDKKDAANVADLIGQGRCLYYDKPEAKLTTLRSLVGLQVRLKKEEHKATMRIRNNLIARYFPELDDCCPKTDELALSVIERLLTPASIARMEYADFEKAVTGGTIRYATQKNRLRTVWETAKQSIGCEAGESAFWEAKLLVGNLRLIREHIRANEAKIQEAAGQFPEYRYLLSIPGFGKTISAMVLSAIGDARQYDNRRQLLRLAGLDLCALRSGKKSDRVSPILSKQGKAPLRYMLVQAAKVGSTAHCGMRKYYLRLLKGRENESGIKLKMWVKLAAKLLVVAWTLMKKKELFDMNSFITYGAASSITNVEAIRPREGQTRAAH